MQLAQQILHLHKGPGGISQVEFTAGGNLPLNPKINHGQLGEENGQVKESTQELGEEFRGAQSKGPEGANCVSWVPIHPQALTLGGSVLPTLAVEITQLLRKAGKIFLKTKGAALAGSVLFSTAQDSEQAER